MLNDDSDTQPYKKTRIGHLTAGSSQDLPARIETVDSASTSSGSLSRANVLNNDGPLDDEFDPNNMAFESAAPESYPTNYRSSYLVSSKSGRQLGGSLAAETDLMSEDDFDLSDLLSENDDFHEDASRSKKRNESALARSSHLSQIASGKKKGIPRPLTVRLTCLFGGPPRHLP